jgi:cellulose synthase operon protein C
MAFAILKTRPKTWLFRDGSISFCARRFLSGWALTPDSSGSKNRSSQGKRSARMANQTTILEIADIPVTPMATGLQVKINFPSLLVIVLILIISVVGMAQQNSFENRLQQVAGLIRENRIAEAEQQLNSILKRAPDEAGALNLLGTIRASQRRLNEAETLFGRAIRKDQQLVGAHMNLAYLYLLKGSPVMAIAKLKEVVSLAPNNLEALYKLARLQMNQAMYDDCIRVIETARQSQPLPAAFLVLQGDAFLGKGDMGKAEAIYLQVLGKQSDAVEALLGIVQISFARGDSKSAFEYLVRARDNAGKSPDLLYKFALTALKSGAFEEARSSLEQLVRNKPDEPAYYLALGATWLKKPDLFEAEQVFRRALKLQPDSAQGQMYLGYTLLKQKNYAEARLNLEKSIQSDTGLPEPFYYLALIAQEQNDDAKAIALLQRLIERFPAFINANVHVALGSSLMKLKDYERAKKHLETAVKLNPEEPKAHYNLAMLYARLKDPERAQEEMKIVERLKNRSEQATESDLLAPPSPRRNP